ncbi:hypothetical protein KR054_002685 [Drosophila jambulina]|nr:hypothetical protein KR054_002685 [Drosophila jambulina]
MFRAGKLQRCVSSVAKEGPLPHCQRRRMELRSLQRGLATRSMGAPSATAQVTGGGNQKQPNQPQDVSKSELVSWFVRLDCLCNSFLTSPKQNWPKKIFSGIQPTGSLHLGNYLGAVRQWVQLQNAKEDVTVCIVDMHSITMPHNPPQLRENIFIMAATLLACGIDPAKSTLFVQSAVPEHAEFNWILSSLTTMPRLAQLPQFREKSRLVKDIPLGLYVYPVLQAADIMLYKATHVPVGADQLQHIQLAQHLARTYNGRYGETFPVCHAIIEDGEASRVLSLRDPSKKMSKSDGNPKATINLADSPDLIAQKIKKAVTDFTSDISYHPSKRPGVSNLVNIHSQVTGQTIKSVVDEASTLDTAKYKERVAEAVVEHLRPIREQIQHHMTKRNEMIYLLEVGAEKARQQAQRTLDDVKQRLGLGTSPIMPAAVAVAPPLPLEVSKTSASRQMASDADGNVHERHKRMYGFAEPSSGDSGQSATGMLSDSGSEQSLAQPLVRRPVVVPTQMLRVEKHRGSTRPRHVFQMDNINAPQIGFKHPPGLAPNMVTGGLSKGKRATLKPATRGLGFGQGTSAGSNKYGPSANPSALSMITREINAPKKQEFTYNPANSVQSVAAGASHFQDEARSSKEMSAARNTEEEEDHHTTTAEQQQDESDEQSEECEEDYDEEEEEAVEKDWEDEQRKDPGQTKAEI